MTPVTPAPPATPRPAAAPAPPLRRVAAQGVFEARVLLRNGEQLLLALVLPALLLVALARTSVVTLDVGDATRVDVVTPGILALAVMSTAFTGQAITTAFDRRYGVLRLLATTPLGRGGLLGGTVRAEAVLAAANLVWLLLLLGGGVVVPASTMPGPVAAVAPWLPSGALGDALRAALVDGSVDVVALAVLALWAVVAALGVRRWFRWD